MTQDDSRVFLIRWKGCTSKDDTWEPEDNLDCEDLIEKFMATKGKILEARGERSLREAPKKIQRLELDVALPGGPKKYSKRNKRGYR